jgi:hypothetical protein
MARPVVVSPEGLEGIPAVDGREVFLAPRQAEPFIVRTLAALDSERAGDIAAAARLFVRARFSWGHTLADLEGLVLGVSS